ncbi:MAG: hypothetical protein VYA51_04965 [Planctomycetota bacterium]|nr:hypothetical protein [Planctomycetota bacterium]
MRRYLPRGICSMRVLHEDWVRRSLVAALLLLAGAAPAQALIGERAPKATWLNPACCGEITLSGPEAAGLTLIGFYASRPDLLQGDWSYLDAIAARYAEDGVQVLLVTTARGADAARRAAGCFAFVDEAGLAEKEWLGDIDAPQGRLVAVDGDGVVQFVGAPGCGVVDMLERQVAGAPDGCFEERARSWRAQLVEGYDDLASGPTITLLEPMVARAPRDGLLSGLLYLTYATKANDAEAARALQDQAIAAMADAPRALAAFADLALRGDPLRPELWRALRAPLQDAAARAADDPTVQLALLRALISDHDDRAAGRLAMTCHKRVCATAEGCLDFAMLLVRAETPMVYGDLARGAVARAVELGGDARLIAAAQYVIALRCEEDRSGADAVLAGYLADRGALYSHNNDAWSFLTGLATAARFDWFAVGLVECLLVDEAAMDYFELDTAALAMFLVGRAEEAVGLQEAALAQGGSLEAAYRDRLARYKAYQALSLR